MPVPRLVLGALLLVGLVLPAALATHTAPADWITRNPNLVRGVFDERALVYLEADQEAGPAFLSVDDPKAGAATQFKLADAAQGINGIAASLQAGVPSQTWTISTKTPLARDYFLNLSYPITGTFNWSQPAWTTASASGLNPDWCHIRFELFVGSTRVGGYEDSFHPAVRSGTWIWLTTIIWPEVTTLPAGEILSLKISRTGNLGEMYFATEGPREGYFDVRYTSIDPLQGALYLKDRRLVSYDGSSEGLAAAQDFAETDEFLAAPEGAKFRVDAPPSERNRPAPVVAFLGLIALPFLRRRGLVVLLAVGLASAGCLGAKTTLAPNGAGDEPPKPTASITYENRTDLAKPGIGAIEGTVRDDIGFLIEGAHIALLGTSLFTDTDENGTFGFSEVAMGEYALRVDAKSYQPHEQTFEVKAGQATKIDVVLVPQVQKSGGDKPHVHGSWGDATSLVLQDVPVTFGDCVGRDHSSSVYGSRCRVAIPIDPYKPVPSGTSLVEVVLKWTPGSTGPKELGLEVATGVQHYAWVSHGGSGLGVFTQYFVARKPNDPIRIAIFPNEADPGHQKFTNWQFWVHSSNADALTPHRVPATTAVTVQVQIIAHKGVIPYEPPHRDFWGDADEIVLYSHSKRGPGADTGFTTSFPSFSYAWRMDDRKDGVLVPPGTAEVRGYLAWDNSLGLTQTKWRIMYRPADLPPSTTFGNYPEATMTGSGTNLTFVIKPTPAQVDQVYQKLSYWWFFAEDEDQPYNSSPRTTWYLTAVAVKDPSFSLD
ncbi:MAG: carboxypeptidase regulatory-like domain-containing protein [Euryarchaeota archaeon]|nr:carboxypeptidase regulatory-like domain-containing protein [Euryarchaeota archaeon]